MKFKVAAIQMKCALGEPQTNLKKAARYVKGATDKGAKMVCLPELFDSGYDLKWVKLNAAGQFPRTKAFLCDLASDLGVYIVAGAANRRRDKLYNSAHVFSPAGSVLGCYDKNHPFPLTDEGRFFSRGKGVYVSRMKYCRAGMAICFDLRFPDLFSRQVKKGAKIVFLPSAWGVARMHHWLMLLRARAVENQAYFIAANQVGKAGKLSFSGQSAIVDYDGQVLAERKKGDGFVIAEIDVQKLNKRRKELPLIS